MALISIFPKADTPPDDSAEVISVSKDTTRSESAQRLQVGLAGLGTMVLLIGLAQVGYDRAATIAPQQPVPVQNDPLAEAGVVPDLPAEPIGQPVQEPAIMPEQGNAPPPRQ